MVYNLGVWEKPPLDEFMHYGVPGMKWGHHKRQAPVEISQARKIVKQRKEDLKKAHQKERRDSLYGLKVAPKQTLKEVERATNEYQYSKDDLASAKILNQLKGKPKTKTQLKLEEKYKKKGMSDNEAAVAAYKNIRMRKILAVVGGVAVVSLAAYGAYKFHDNRVDKIIKSGTKLQHITEDSTTSIRDAFYSSSNKLDRIKYKGMYSKEIKARGIDQVFKKEVKVLSDIRQASHKNAQTTLSELMKNDPDFAKGIKDYVEGPNKLGYMFSQTKKAAEKSLSQGKVDTSVYRYFNSALIDHSPEAQPLIDKYYKALSDKGYNAIKDVYDSRYSRYNSINPIITFNSAGLVKVTDVRQLVDEEIQKSWKVAYGSIVGAEMVATGSTIAAFSLGSRALGTSVKTAKDNKVVDQYRQQHPNTNLTYTDIVRMLERGKLNK